MRIADIEGIRIQCDCYDSSQPADDHGITKGQYWFTKPNFKDGEVWTCPDCQKRFCISIQTEGEYAMVGDLRKQESKPVASLDVIGLIQRLSATTEDARRYKRERDQLKELMEKFIRDWSRLKP